ncbi:MAG: NPCBM/NEW2 domain-containing protein [Candidatus Hinthialibacter sp.]
MPANQTEDSELVENREWTPSRIAALVLLVILCGVLVWNAYHPEDVYFSDLKFEVLQSDRFEPQKDQSVEGNTLTIQHGDTPTYYPRGVGVHANSEIFLKFLPNGYRFFVAEIGVDKEAAEIGSSSVVFQILSDGTLMYESPVLRAGMAPRFVRVCIEGRETLTLKVSDAGDGHEGDHADWAMARFTVQ